ncbi:MAG: molybdate ABC transporter substrate-binding protein [Phycisphaerales bacterium]|nr:molybdate ABC transporter substrate-binding protein [Phycisphaerales bacterium]
MQAALTQGFGAPVRFTFGSSGMLARQIENGAPFDVFLSADDEFVNKLGDRVEDRFAYAAGRLAIWSKSGKYQRLGELEAAKVIAIANPATAPYGRAAKAALERAGLWERVKSRVVYAESVRQAFQFAESGNADVCLCSGTFVLSKGGTVVREAAPLRQVAARVKGSPNEAAGRVFLDWLRSRAGQAVLRQGGLEPLD